MRRYILLISALFITASCGEAEGPVAKNKNAAVTANNTNVAATAANQVAANTNSPISNTNGQPANSSNVGPNPLTASRNKKIEAMRQAASDPNAPRPDTETILSQSTRPAPENSQFAVALTDILVERRTFLKNPMLAKVEKTTRGPEKSIKVFLTDGRTIDLPGDAIQSLSTASSASILKAAGVQAANPRPAEKPSAPTKN